jgi:hypothetical protein
VEHCRSEDASDDEDADVEEDDEDAWNTLRCSNTTPLFLVSSFFLSVHMHDIVIEHSFLHITQNVFVFF